MTLLDHFPHTVEILRPSYAQGAAGGDTIAAFATVAAETAAWIQPARASTITEYRRRDQKVEFSVYFRDDPAPDLKPGDYIKPAADSFMAGKMLKFVDYGGAGAGVLELWRADFVRDREAEELGEET